MLSNPAQTKAIAASKKKTDKVDAHILADLLRGGYVAESHVPDEEVIATRQLVRYRHDKVQQRTQCKNTIHAFSMTPVHVPERPPCIVIAVARHRFGSPVRQQAGRFCNMVRTAQLR